jgi:hypothetical protein
MLCCRMNTWYVGRLSSYPGDHFAAGRYCHRAKERRESQMVDCVVRGRRKNPQPVMRKPPSGMLRPPRPPLVLDPDQDLRISNLPTSFP